MLASALRVTGIKETDWIISKEPSHERYSSGIEEMKEGKKIGFAKMMYTRVFYADGCGNFEHNKGAISALLGLPEEDTDEATGVAMERSKVHQWGDWNMQRGKLLLIVLTPSSSLLSTNQCAYADWKNEADSLTCKTRTQERISSELAHHSKSFIIALCS